MTVQFEPIMTVREFAKVIADDLDGTCDTIDSMLEKYERNFEIDELEAELCIEFGLERCQGCDWWMESGLLDGGENDEWEGYCDDCRPEEEEE